MAYVGRGAWLTARGRWGRARRERDWRILQLMGLGELAAWQWACAGVAALVTGLSKAGFGGGAAMLAVPLMAAALGPAAMLAVMLLVLIGGDVFSVIHYLDKHDRRNLAMLVPGLATGICLGYLALGWFLALPDSELWMKRMIGLVCVGFVSVQLYRMRGEARLGAELPAYRPRAWHGVGVGVVAGVASTLAHAGGPFVDIFLLPQRLEKRVFVGTVVKFFLVGNVLKLIPYWQKGMMTRQAAVLALVLMPCVVLGTFVGLMLNRRFSDRAFRMVVYCFALCVGLFLVAGSRPRAPTGALEAARDGQTAFRAGLKALEQGDDAGAARAFAAAAGDGLLRDRALFNMGLACYEAARYAEGETVFAQVKGSADRAVAMQAGFNLGNCAYRLGRFGDAADRYAETATACRRELGVLMRRTPGRQGVDLPELLRRAEHNLALAQGRSRAAGRSPVAATSPAEGWRTSDAGRSSQDAVGAGEGRPAERARSGTGSAAGSAAGVRDVAGVLADVTSRDTGPVVKKGRPQYLHGSKGW